MYRLMFTGDLITGFQRQETIDNLASLLEMSYDQVRETLFTGQPEEFKQVDDKAEADQWRRAFGEAGAVLIVLPGDEDTPGGSRYAGADPASTNVEDPTPASVTARLPGVRRRNHAYLMLGVIALVLAVIIILGAWLVS